MFGPGKAPRVAHVRPHVRLHVAERLAQMVAVVVHPLMQKLIDGQASDLGMQTATWHLLGAERAHQLDALAADFGQFLLQLLGVAGAVVAVLDDPVAIPGRQVGLVGAEDDLDPAREPVSLGLDHMADDLVDTPFAWSGTPRRQLGGEGVEGRSKRVARGLEQVGDLARGHCVAGTTRVPGFSITPLTSAINFGPRHPQNTPRSPDTSTPTTLPAPPTP